ncbi:MAG: CbiX/SirB N-terminal domain-containing protein [Chromatiales bacterium]|nr:CbiX/SirB N-terminal domain-containing protein [Chromatiales bacterium]
MIQEDDNAMLLVVAHGSRRASSNEEVRQLAQRIKALPDCRFTVVKAAFLELEAPSIPDGISECIAAGASEVLVMPYFLSRGRHVVEDVPGEVEVARQRHPDAKITLCEYLGGQESIASLILAGVQGGN